MSDQMSIEAIQNLSFLALGDSYTIGEGVNIQDSFPYQTADILRNKNIHLNPPIIVAKTGWTTGELYNAVVSNKLTDKYDIITILIGVNNQYRGNAIQEFSNDYEMLLQKAISLAGNKVRHVFALSIPDWSVTPFAEGREKKKIANEINAFNDMAESISRLFQVAFIDITTEYKARSSDPSFIAQDKLHPSGKEYKAWSEKIATEIVKSYTK
ncbi:MAG: lysophospholipase [Chitinophagaceae bacterium]|nr:MAG: lysophospholipase [Chitinophagaceae bacterium]